MPGTALGRGPAAETAERAALRGELLCGGKGHVPGHRPPGRLLGLGLGRGRPAVPVPAEASAHGLSREPPSAAASWPRLPASAPRVGRPRRPAAPDQSPAGTGSFPVGFASWGLDVCVLWTFTRWCRGGPHGRGPGPRRRCPPSAVRAPVGRRVRSLPATWLGVRPAPGGWCVSGRPSSAPDPGPGGSGWCAGLGGVSLCLAGRGAARPGRGNTGNPQQGRRLRLSPRATASRRGQSDVWLPSERFWKAWF